MNVVQIGANRSNDDISQIVLSNKINNFIIVEPLSIHNDSISLCYKGVPHTIENVAISNTSSNYVNLYYHMDDTPNYEISSLNKNHVTHQAELHGWDKSRIVEFRVKSMSINDLLEKHQIFDVDILVIDAEGLDDILIKSINFDKYNIKNIIYENLHINDISIYLEGKGYNIIENWSLSDCEICHDSLAIKKGSNFILHYYQNIGENWFGYQNLYKSMVDKFESGSKFVEIGSWKGRSSAFLGTEIINSGKEIKLDCIDTWNGSIENITPGSVGYEPNLSLDKNWLFNIFKKNVSPLNITEIRIPSISASELYNDNSIDFIFIDASHQYEDVKNDIISWFPKLKRGGVIAGHDYSWCDDVKKAVDEFFINKKVDEQDGCWIYHNNKNIVVDCFLFNNEFKMLELRLEENFDLVDYFVLVESNRTFTNNPKELYYKNNKHLFSKYNHKIINVIIDDMPEGNDGIYNKVGKGSNWNREHHQRNSMIKGLLNLNLKDDDIILIGDVDEIISSNCLSMLKENGVQGIYVLYYDCYVYNLETMDPNPWTLPRITNYKSLLEVGGIYNVRDTWGYNKSIFPNGQTADPGNAWIISKAGWHFSYFGGKDSIIDKVESFSHQELNTVEILGKLEDNINNKISIDGSSKYIHINLNENGFLPKNYQLIK